MNISSTLEKLDFTSGIRAATINKNFDTVHDWITKERRQLGGYGIIDGFTMSANNSNFTVSVSAGHMITDAGEELAVDSAVFTAGPLESTKHTYTAVCSQDGVVEIPVRPYSDIRHGYIEMFANGSNPDEKEFYVSDAETNERVQVLQIINNKVYVDAEIWAFRRLKIDMLTADNRVDSVLISSEGKYRYEKGILSTSPSHVDAKDYPGWFLIGTIEWQAQTGSTKARFFTNHRTYRKVYVNEKNELYLNGRLYHDAQLVYFSEPEVPEEHDLWYDKTTNKLYVWELTTDGWKWVNVNDHSNKEVRACKIWAPKDFPSDNRTFLFNDTETDMFFDPNKNALEIIIDNTILMRDQFEEITKNIDTKSSRGVLKKGVGFRLKDPLGRKTYVQCTVNHFVKADASDEAFQKAATFSASSYCAFSKKDNPNQIFSTAAPYVVGEEQLEVYVNGTRLVPDLDYKEMVNEKAVATDADKISGSIIAQTFKVTKTLTDGQVVSHRLLKHVWSYDHVTRLMQDIAGDATEALRQCKDLRVTLTNYNGNSIKRDQAMSNDISSIDTKASQVVNCFKKTDIIPSSRIDAAIKNKLVGKLIDINMPANKLMPIDGVTDKDFIQVHIISKAESRILIKNIDYTAMNASDGLRISLKAELMLPTATIYVTGFKIGA